MHLAVLPPVMQAAAALAPVGGLDRFWSLLDGWQAHLIARGVAETTRDQYESYLVRGLRRGRLSPERTTALLEEMREGQTTLIGVKSQRLGQWFHDAAEAAGFPKGRVHAHLARHTAGTLFYRRTRDPMMVKDFLGHSDLSQIQRYVRADQEQMKRELSVSLISTD